MLDVLMVAHHRNYNQMASLHPQASSPDLVPVGALPSAVNSVSVNGRVVLSLEGGRHQDFHAAETYLYGQNLEWKILHNTQVSGHYEALMRGLGECTQPVVAIIPPWVKITDQQWVQRMVWPMQKNQQALLCTTYPECGPAKDMAPFVGKPRMWPGGGIIVGRRADVTGFLRLAGPEDTYQKLADASSRAGWNLWIHPGIRFEVLEHEEHRAGRSKAGR